MNRLIAFAGLFAAGCGPSEHPVTGSVKFPDGRPLAQGQIVLESSSLSLGTGGDIKPDGTFKTRPAPVGNYAVYLVGVGENRVSDMPGGRPMVDEKYIDPKTSGLTVEVGPGAELHLTVEPPSASKRFKDAPKPLEVPKP